MKTRQRFEESKFLLEKLLAVHSNSDFDNFLNAFISSARSVAWVMTAEYKDVDGWKERKPTEREGSLLKVIKNERFSFM